MICLDYKSSAALVREKIRNEKNRAKSGVPLRAEGGGRARIARPPPDPLHKRGNANHQLLAKKEKGE
jgi:hypothetical protein